MPPASAGRLLLVILSPPLAFPALVPPSVSLPFLPPFVPS